MCKLNIQCLKFDGECNCSASSELSLNTKYPVNTLLASILTHVQAQPELWKNIEENHQGLKCAQPSHLTHISSPSPSQTENFSGEFEKTTLCLVSGLDKALVVGKPFSLLVDFDKKRQIVDKDQGEISFSVFVESRKDKAVSILIGNVRSKGAAIFKKLVVNEVIENAKIVIKVDGVREIEPFVKNVRIKEKVLGECLKKIKVNVE